MKTFFRVLTLLLLSAIVLNASHKKVTLQLEWLHQFQFAGFYVAKERGFYKDAGLDIDIKEANGSMDVINEVLQKKANFGVSHSSLLIHQANGKELIALGAIYQHSPSVLITVRDDIKTLKDLENKNIMVTSNALSGVSIMSMLLSEGLSTDNANFQKHSYNLQDLINGKTDAMACYISNEPYFLEKQNISYKIFRPQDYGFDFYEDIIFTSKQQLTNHPKETKKFYEASIKGWQWAFEHIEESAQIIYEKYNSQNKSLESLIYEGKALKKLALAENGTIGFIDKGQIENIANIYRLSALLPKKFDFSPYIDPLMYNKKPLHLGVLAKRGDNEALKKWRHLAKYLNKTLKHYYVDIHPIEFKKIKNSIKNQEIDFLLTNTMNYVQLENSFGVSRIATLKNRNLKNTTVPNNFGSVIFTLADSKIETLNDIVNKRVAAVDENSFGGWAIGYELLESHDISKDQYKLNFYGTHDNVVYAIENKKADVGIIRTDIIESMINEGTLKQNEIKIIHPMHYDNFPYIVSTKLYPEWPFAKLQHVSDKTALEVTMALYSMSSDSQEAIDAKIAGWTVP